MTAGSYRKGDATNFEAYYRMEKRLSCEEPCGGDIML